MVRLQEALYCQVPDLFAIAPNGMISFMSAGWRGRTSDKHIVNQSGFLDILDPGDVILADRWFTINSELSMHKARPSAEWSGLQF